MEKRIFLGYSEPLASKLRPTTIEEYIGQEHLIAEGKMLRNLMESDNIPSMIFFGPPGVGKTTLARVISEKTKAEFVNFSAVSSGIKEVREVMKQAKNLQQFGKKTIVFIDEIHRFNKAQQDAFLPFVENGSVVLIGATTENPSFEINSALLSRCKVFLLYALTADDVKKLLKRAISLYEKDFEIKVKISEKLVDVVAEFANGDARSALNTFEMIANSANFSGNVLDISEEIVKQSVSKKLLLYDKKGEEHYNIISALHKSMRNSDVQAAIYWLTRMLDGGEDPLYVARRIVRFASEDIGMADSNALLIAVTAYQACHYIGMPECGVHLTHAVVYCAQAEKSNALYVAYNEAMKDCRERAAEPVPLHLRNAPTRLMKELDYGKGYQYAHDFKCGVTAMQCLPDGLKGRVYYQPTDRGKEAKIKERMEQIDKAKKKS